MEVMLQRGFPARADGGDALNVVTQDSSSGRTVGAAVVTVGSHESQ